MRTGLFGTIIVTVAVSLILQNVILALAGTYYCDYTPEIDGLVHVAGMVFTKSQLAIIALAVVMMAAIHALLHLTKFGKSMRATAVNPRLARSQQAVPRLLERRPVRRRVLCAGHPGAFMPALSVRRPLTAALPSPSTTSACLTAPSLAGKGVGG